MDLEDAVHLARIRFPIRDRDATYPGLIDKILDSAEIATVPAGVRIPRMNLVMERWVKTVRTDLPARTLIWNQAHLRYALREYERHYNEPRTHRSLAAAAPLRARPQPLDPGQIERGIIDGQDRLGGVIHEYRHVPCSAWTSFSARTATAPHVATVATTSTPYFTSRGGPASEHCRTWRARDD